MIMLADQYSGEQAFSFNLVNFVFSSEELESKVTEITSKLLKRGPLALQKAKQVVDTVYSMDINSALEVEHLAQLALLPSKDVQEGSNGKTRRKISK